jgi:hypothetical protein
VTAAPWITAAALLALAGLGLAWRVAVFVRGLALHDVERDERR